MSKPFYVVIDAEMSGPDPRQHDIIDICMIFLDITYEEVCRYKTYIHPVDPLENWEEAEEIVGYSEEKWKENNAMTQEEFSSDVISFIKEMQSDCPHGLIPIGHGIHHDLDYLMMIYDYDTRMWDLINSNAAIDLIALEIIWEMIYDDVTPNPISLQELCDTYCVDLDRPDGRHTASGDAQATLEVFRKQMGLLCAI